MRLCSGVFCGAFDSEAASRRGEACRRPLRCAVLAASLVVAGCAGIGAHRLPVDRFDYSAAIASSTNEQMLLNLVRLRYNETPIFLDVNTVIAQYQVDTRAGLGAEVGFSGSTDTPGDNLVIPVGVAALLHVL